MEISSYEEIETTKITDLLCKQEMKHELRIIETSTGKHIATVSESEEEDTLVERAKNSAAALHKDFHFEIINLDMLFSYATIVPGKANARGIYCLRWVFSLKLRNRVELWSPNKWVITMGAGEVDPKTERKQYLCNAHMLRNDAIFRVYDVERCKYLKRIKN